MTRNDLATRNEAVVLMHFGQALSPAQVRAVLGERLPAGLRERVVASAVPL